MDGPTFRHLLRGGVVGVTAVQTDEIKPRGRTARIAQTRFRVVCDEHTTRRYDTWAEAEKRMEQIVTFGACLFDHRIVSVVPPPRTADGRIASPSSPGNGTQT